MKSNLQLMLDASPDHKIVLSNVPVSLSSDDLADFMTSSILVLVGLKEAAVASRDSQFQVCYACYLTVLGVTGNEAMAMFRTPVAASLCLRAIKVR